MYRGRRGPIVCGPSLLRLIESYQPGAGQIDAFGTLAQAKFAPVLTTLGGFGRHHRMRETVRVRCRHTYTDAALADLFRLLNSKFNSAPDRHAPIVM